MPHMFINRPRIYNLTKGRSDLKAQFRWETINAIFYKVGGIIFIVGSILFFHDLKLTPTMGLGRSLLALFSTLS